MTSKLWSVLVVSLLFALFVRTFVLEGFFVQGDSMDPTLQSGDYVFIYKLAYWHSDPKRGDIIVAYPRQYTTKVVKRVAVLPGERYELVPGKTDNIDPQEYFLLGDNTQVSIDSRVFGPVDRWDIQGRVIGAFRIKTFKYLSF